MTVTRAQYVASTEDIAPVMTALMFRCTVYVLFCLHICFSPGNNMGIIRNHEWVISEDMENGGIEQNWE